MKNENVNNEEFDKCLSYCKAIYEYEENVNSFCKSLNEIKEEGYLVYLDDYSDIKELLNYNNSKKFLNGNNKNKKNFYFNINKFNQIKLLEPIKIKSIDHLDNIIINIGCILITKELFELLSNNKEKPISFIANKNKITLLLKNKEKLDLNHSNFIMELDKSSHNDNNEIKDIYNSMGAYLLFENSIINNSIEDRAKYGLLLKKTWIDEWKNYSNYENIQSKYFIELTNYNKKKPSKIIITLKK